MLGRKKKAKTGWQAADETTSSRGQVMKERLGDGFFVWATMLKPLLPNKGKETTSISQNIISLGEMLLEVLQKPLPRVILAIAFLQIAWMLLQ